MRGTKTVKIDKDTTTIIAGAGQKDQIKARQPEIRDQVEGATSHYDREKLQERLGKLVGADAARRKLRAEGPLRVVQDWKAEHGRRQAAMACLSLVKAHGLLSRTSPPQAREEKDAG